MTISHAKDAAVLALLVCVAGGYPAEARPSRDVAPVGGSAQHGHEEVFSASGDLEGEALTNLDGSRRIEALEDRTVKSDQTASRPGRRSHANDRIRPRPTLRTSQRLPTVQSAGSISRAVDLPPKA